MKSSLFDEPDSASVVIIIHIHACLHELRQSLVHVPGLDHAPIDRHGHALIVECAGFLGHVCPIALPAICDFQPGLAAALGHGCFFLDGTRVLITTSPHSTHAHGGWSRSCARDCV